MFVRHNWVHHHIPDPEGDGDRGDSWTPTDEVDDAALATKKAEDDAAAAKKVDDDAAAAKKVEDDAAAAAKKLVDDAKTDDEKAADKLAEDAKKLEDDKKKDTRIPAARHKEILDKQRLDSAAERDRLEAELKKYKDGAKVANVNTEIAAAETALEKLEADYAKHVVDGNADKAAAVMKDIRKSERSIIEKTTELRLTAANAHAIETVRYDTTVERIEAEYPQLNLDHADFDKAKTIEVLEMKEAWVKQGYTPSQALQKAVKYVMPPETKKQEEVLKVEPKVDAKDVEKQRKADAVKKALETEGKTPPNATKVGLDSDKKGGGAVTAADALKMSHKDFSELDETTLARMRGDTFEGA